MIIGLIKNYNIAEFSKSLAKIPQVSGRLEQFSRSGVTVYVDYAHTPDAMKSVLSSIKTSYSNQKLITIFGCGGDRDSGKPTINAFNCLKIF